MSGLQLLLSPRLSSSYTLQRNPLSALTSCILVSSLLFLFLPLYYLLRLKEVVCLQTRLKNSAGPRLAPIIRAWQGAAVSTCQTNKHPLWHPPSCVWSGVSQPPSSGPLILVLAHSADTSTLTAVNKGAIVLQCRAAIIVTHGHFAVDEGTKKEAQLRKSPTLGGSALCPFKDLRKIVCSAYIGQVHSIRFFSSLPPSAFHLHPVCAIGKSERLTRLLKKPFNDNSVHLCKRLKTIRHVFFLDKKNSLPRKSHAR